MKKIFLSLAMVLFSIALIAQATTQTALSGKVQFTGFSAGGTADVVGNLDSWNDQTNQYFANAIAAGDVVWDNAGNRWEVMVVNSSNLFSANVDLRDINSAGGVPSGVGIISRETPNLGLSLFTPDNNIGISQQLKSRIETHNMILIDAVSTTGDNWGSDVVVSDGTITGDGTPGSPLSAVGDNWGAQVIQHDGASVSSGDGTVASPLLVPSAGIKTVYDAGLGFWCYCTAGVTVTSASAGVYDISIPTDADVSSIQKNFTNAGTEYTVGGEAVLNIDWNTASWNTSFTNAVLPDIRIYDPAGTQREPGAVSVTSQTTGVSGGETATTVANINGLGTPTRIKIQQ